MKYFLWMMALCLALFTACRPKAETSTLEVLVDYSVNGGSLEVDTLKFVNEAGNHFMINEIQWFISRIELQDKAGTWVPFRNDDNLYYLDTDLPETHQILSEALPVGTYQAIRFTFGLDEADNLTGRFPNPPESNMFWPDPLGGGYHYMKMNGRWLTEAQELAPFNLHLGIGQNEDKTVFYHNHFSVTLPLHLDLKPDSTEQIQLLMVIDNWFRNPHTYDLNHFGGAIMQNQEAQQTLKENGHDVFMVKTSSSFLDELSQSVKGFMHKASPQPHFFTKDHLTELISSITVQQTPK